MTETQLRELVEATQDEVKRQMAPLPFSKDVRNALLDGHKQGMWNIIRELQKTGALEKTL